MNTRNLAHPHVFRPVRRLLLGYLALGIATLVAVVLLRNHPAEVTSAVWIRSVVVVGTAMILISAATLAARGSRGAYIRLRAISVVTTVAIVVIVALPGTFPVWLRVEQGVCGVLMLGVALLTNGKKLRSEFAARAAGQRA